LVRRYGGLNVHNLNNAHAVAPHKFLLATEACNCPGVVFREQTTEWWQARAPPRNPPWRDAQSYFGPAQFHTRKTYSDVSATTASQRAEHIGMDILEDLLHWTTGWTDWNLILDTTGGPNHLGNRCDANLIADPKNKMGYGTIVMQVHACMHACAHHRRVTLLCSRLRQYASPVPEHAHATRP